MEQEPWIWTDDVKGYGAELLEEPCLHCEQTAPVRTFQRDRTTEYYCTACHQRRASFTPWG